MKILKVSLAFAELSNLLLDSFTENVHNKMTGNPAFPTPPLSLSALALLNTAFTNALSAARKGSVESTTLKNAARADLIAGLRQIANYVQITADTVAILESSGFYAVNLSHTQTELPAPVITSVVNKTSGQLKVNTKAVPNAKSYEARVSVNGAAPVSAGAYPNSRSILLTGLTPGTVYVIQIRAVGGSTGWQRLSVIRPPTWRLKPPAKPTRGATLAGRAFFVVPRGGTFYQWPHERGKSGRAEDQSPRSELELAPVAGRWGWFFMS